MQFCPRLTAWRLGRGRGWSQLRWGPRKGRSEQERQVKRERRRGSELDGKDAGFYCEEAKRRQARSGPPNPKRQRTGTLLIIYSVRSNSGSLEVLGTHALPSPFLMIPFATPLAAPISLFPETAGSLTISGSRHRCGHTRWYLSWVPLRQCRSQMPQIM